MQKTSSTTNPHFSIIIPTYNAKKFIQRAIGSVLNQTFEDFEVVVVDDASKDSTVEILKRISEEDLRVRYFVQDKNSGTLATRARGVEKARGEYILLLDQDDELKSKTLEKVKEALDKNPVDILHFGVEVVPESEGAIGAAKGCEEWLNPAPRILFNNDILKMQFCEQDNFDFMVHHKAFKAELAKKSWTIYSSEHLCASDDFFMSFILCTYAQSYIALDDSKYYIYHLGAGETYTENYEFNDWKRTCDVEARALALIKDFAEEAKNEVERCDWEERISDCQLKLIEHIMNEIHDKLPANEASRCINYALQSWEADAVAGELWRFVRDRAYDDLVNHVDSKNDDTLKTLVKQAEYADSFVRKFNSERYSKMKEIANAHLDELRGWSPSVEGPSPFARIKRAFRKG